MKFLIILPLFFLVLSCTDKNDLVKNETCDDKICGENQICKVIDEEAICECEIGFEMENDICKKLPILCSDECNSWEECDTNIGECSAKYGLCNKDIECDDEKYCNLEIHECTDNCNNNSDCPIGEICSNSRKCEEVFLCDNNADCYEHDEFWNEVTNPVLCKQGVCTLKPCKENSECVNDSISEVCNAGICEAEVSCSDVRSIKITTNPFIITTDETYQVKAVALNIDGIPLNLNKGFTWSTSDNRIVDIDNNGIALGGNVPGLTFLKASICNKNSNTLLVENYAKLDRNKLRVTIFDMKGNRLSNVIVKVNDSIENTNEEGYLLIDNTETINNITITKDGYISTTFLSTSEKDLLIYLDKEKSKLKSGGFKGEFNFDNPTIVDNGQVMIGLAGSSINGSMLDFKLKDLLSMEVTKDITFMGNSSDVNLASGIELIISEEDVVSDKYNVLGDEGNAVFWGWGGRTSILELMPFITSALNGDASNLDVGKLLAKMVSIAVTFNHSIKINQNINLCDNIIDVYDINGNGDLEELVPDFNSTCFPILDMELNQPLSLYSTIKYPELPIIDGKQASESISIISTITNNGRILLGIGGSSDKVDENDIADGKLDDIVLPYAPQHSGVMNNDSIVALTTNLNDPEKGLLRSTNIISIYKNGVIDDIIDYSNQTYLKLAENATLIDNIISFSVIPRASLYRVNITDINDNNWIIYSPVTNIPLNDKPENISEIKSIIVQAITLQKDEDSISYGDLLRGNDSNLDDLIRLVTKFSSYEIDLSVE